MEQRKRRRKKHRKGKPMAVDSWESVNSEKSLADMIQLAHKYMQKCRVESSTDSESDANAEVPWNSSFPGGSLEKTTYKKLQFLDPYDGDYEELSDTSDCSVDSLAEACPGSGFSLKHLIPESLSVKENVSPKHQEFVFAPPYWGVSTSVTHETDCTNSRDNLMFTEHATEDDGKCLPLRLSQEVEPGETASVFQLKTEPPWFIQHDPSECGRFSENVPSVLQPIVRLSDKRACDNAAIKRKQGQPIPECAGERLRKKLRAT